MDCLSGLGGPTAKGAARARQGGKPITHNLRHAESACLDGDQGRWLRPGPRLAR
jgi:hypothetical protein